VSHGHGFSSPQVLSASVTDDVEKVVPLLLDEQVEDEDVLILLRAFW
jgi:hypothetical protein